MFIPGDNVRQQLDKNSVHTNSPEETREPHCQFIHYPREFQSSSKISKDTTIYLICTGILVMVLPTKNVLYCPISLQHFCFFGYQTTGWFSCVVARLYCNTHDLTLVMI
jgi:hypothetical protein